MFECIRHSYTEDGQTGASYTDGDVTGYVSFSSDPDRTGVISCIGPDESLRECSFSHWLGFRNRYRARARETVEDYSPQPAEGLGRA